MSMRWSFIFILLSLCIIGAVADDWDLNQEVQGQGFLDQGVSQVSPVYQESLGSPAYQTTSGTRGGFDRGDSRQHSTPSRQHTNPSWNYPSWSYPSWSYSSWSYPSWNYYDWYWGSSWPTWSYYSTPVWHYTTPVVQYTTPAYVNWNTCQICFPATTIGTKTYYSLSMTRYYSVGSTSLALPVGLWW